MDGTCQKKTSFVRSDRSLTGRFICVITTTFAIAPSAVSSDDTAKRIRIFVTKLLKEYKLKCTELIFATFKLFDNNC
jgi:hypothetical protein